MARECGCSPVRRLRIAFRPCQRLPCHSPDNHESVLDTERTRFERIRNSYRLGVIALLQRLRRENLMRLDAIGRQAIECLLHVPTLVDVRGDIGTAGFVSYITEARVGPGES